MSNWDYMHPDIGSMANLESSTTTMSEARNGLYNAELGTQAARAVADYSVWSGTAGAAWRSKTLSVENELTPPRTSLTNAIRAINAYIDEVNAIKSQAATEREKLRNATAIVMHFDGIDLNPIDNVAELVRKANAGRQVIEAEAAIIGLGNRRQDADNALVSALRSAVPESWADTRRAFESVGLTSSSDLTPAAIADAMAALSASILAGEGGGSVEDLRRFLEIYGNDADVMSEYFVQLGGANTVALIDELGDAYGYSNGNDTAALEVAQRLRTGLSLASQGWDEPTASTFADQMFNGTPDGDIDGGWFEPGRVAAIGYLFADSANAPMGEQLTIATVALVDQWERLDHGAGIAYGLPGTLGDPGMGATSLFGADRPHGAELFTAPQNSADPDQFWWSNIDMAGEVFETLGRYPDGAYEFLDGGSGEPSRMEYWFGDRDWKLDGFEGISDLLAGAQQAEGGPYSTPPIDAVNDRMAELTSQAIWELAGNESFLTENLTEDASGALATSIAPYLDGIADYMLRRGPQDPDGYGFTDATQFWSGTSIPVPVLSDDVLAEFLAAIGSHDTGAGVIQGTIDGFQEYYIRAGIAHPELLDEGLSRSTWLQGALDGSGITGHIGAAERYDESVDEAIDGFMDVVGALPIPGLSDLGGVAGVVGGYAQGQVEDALVQAWKDSLHTTDQVTAEMSNHANAQAINATLNLGHQLETVLGRDLDIPELGADQSPDAYAEELNEWWIETAGQLQAENAVPGLDIHELIGMYLDSRDASSYRAQ
ncbi:hypothetical protein PYV02_09700 [Leifsonia sp. H3M29-4]|uniref:hypothetical protein n=1 Tax=Salinibacterium metalliresistens TaxID=3031321 RepID=UPI0023DBBC1F|nr:hypothetical protein [Salinibacterium metalliresistens]MDF1479354.1 hypothetical protein [Salinibacterium metalliresistens]